MKTNTQKLTLSGVLLATTLLLPFLTGQIPELGRMLSPMHLPILICGFLCGWQYGLAVGFIAPILRFFLFGMPPLFPVGIAMAFELAVYGCITGLLYKKLSHSRGGMFASLVIAMLAGRVVWGIVMLSIMGLTNGVFTFQTFLGATVLGTIPGIICQLILVPAIVTIVEHRHTDVVNEYA